MDCAECRVRANVEPIPRWKASLLFVGALLLCPCHLPVTFAAIAAVGTGLTGAGWLFGNQPLVYAAFSLAYILLVILFFRWVVAARDRERQLMALHAEHAAQP